MGIVDRIRGYLDREVTHLGLRNYVLRYLVEECTKKDNVRNPYSNEFERVCLEGLTNIDPYSSSILKRLGREKKIKTVAIKEITIDPSHFPDEIRLLYHMFKNEDMENTCKQLEEVCRKYAEDLRRFKREAPIPALSDLGEKIEKFEREFQEYLVNFASEIEKEAQERGISIAVNVTGGSHKEVYGSGCGTQTFRRPGNWTLRLEVKDLSNPHASELAESICDRIDVLIPGRDGEAIIRFEKDEQSDRNKVIAVIPEGTYSQKTLCALHRALFGDYPFG
ncbi:MAG: hypothetical protein GXO63_00340 [Candidatus Micrarchaeota archaeon]|nr:hypothetical protein [Candidatus Micrarchaeota archaeon]